MRGDEFILEYLSSLGILNCRWKQRSPMETVKDWTKRWQESCGSEVPFLQREQRGSIEEWSSHQTQQKD